MDEILERIREFSDNAWEELHDANKYIHSALSWKGIDVFVADHYMELANQEIGHFEMLCDMACRTITANPDNDTAKYIWKWMHENLRDKLAELNSKIALYRK